jgi:hypothetical protein
MIDSIVNVASQPIGMAVLGVFLALLVFFLVRSTTLRDQGKKGLTFFLIIAGVLLGYFLLTGKPPTQIPSDINNFFNKSRAPEEQTHRYYQDPEKRYKDYMGD